MQPDAATAILPPPPAGAALPMRAVRCFAWDLADGDAEEIIAGLRESGIDGLHLALAWHGGRFFLPE